MDIKAKKTINLAMDKMTKGRIELKSMQKTSIKTTMENMTKNIAMASKPKKTIKSTAKSSILAFMLSKEVKKQEVLRRKSKKSININHLAKDEKTPMDVAINKCTADQSFSLKNSKQSYHAPNSENLGEDEVLSLDSTESKSCSTDHLLLSNLNTR